MIIKSKYLKSGYGKNKNNLNKCIRTIKKKDIPVDKNGFKELLK